MKFVCSGETVWNLDSGKEPRPSALICALFGKAAVDPAPLGELSGSLGKPVSTRNTSKRAAVSRARLGDSGNLGEAVSVVSAMN